MTDSRAILQERFLQELVGWLRWQKYYEPDFRRMARSGRIGSHPQKHAVFTFSRSHNAYIGLLEDDESRIKPERDVLRSWVTALHKSRFPEPAIILEKCLPFMPAGEQCAPREDKGCNVVRIQTAWGCGGRYKRLELPAVRDCLFTFARHALRYSFEILKRQKAALLIADSWSG